MTRDTRQLRSPALDLQEAGLRTVDAEFHRVRLQVNNAQDVRFEGRLLHEYTTQNRDGSKERWTEIRLWETRAGAWVVENVGGSVRRGEATLRDILVLEPEEADLPHDARRVMDFLGWSIVAKAFARQLGWKIVRDIP